VEFSEIYTPDEAEKKDAKLYAERVRKNMANSLGIPTTMHCYDDMVLQKKALQMKMKQ